MSAYRYCHGYKYNPAETPPKDLVKGFIGRGHIVDRLLAAIREQTDCATIQHYILLGQRGAGKTTLLLMLEKAIRDDRELSRRWFCVRFREEEFSIHTVRDVLAQAVAYLHEEDNIAEAGLVWKAAEAHAEYNESLATVLSGLRRISKERGKRVLLLIDNFDRIFPKRGDRDAQERAFRKLLMTEPLLMVIGTSLQPYEEFAAYDDAFFGFFSPIPLENLTDDEIKQLLLARAELEGNQDFPAKYEANRDKVRAITYLTGGNPRLAVMLYEVLSRGDRMSVVEALRETLDGLTPWLTAVLEDMPTQQSKILDALMRLNGVASPSEIAAKARLSLNTVTTQLGRLKEGRYVAASGEGRGKPSIYHVYEGIFSTWYQMRYLQPKRRRVETFVEFLRAWFAVEARMGSSEPVNGTGGNWASTFARLDELEAGMPTLEQRLESRVEAVMMIAREYTLEAALDALALLAETAPAELRERLLFMKPGLELARSGDTGVLARLPQEEQDLPIRIADKIGQMRRAKTVVEPTPDGRSENPTENG